MKGYLFKILTGLIIMAGITFGVLKFDKPLLGSSVNDQEIKIVAHREASKFAPENTIAALKKAWKMGADYAEIDVRRTSDEKLVIIHDATVNRTTNGKGKVAQLTLAEIKQLDAGSWFDESFAGEKVPTFREALKYMKGKILPDIDFKAGDLKPMVKILREEGFLDKKEVIFFAANGEEIKKMRQLTKKIKFRTYVDGGIRGMRAFHDKYQPEIININEDNFSPEYVEAIHALGMETFRATSGRTHYKRFMQQAIAAGSDYILADNLDVLISLVNKAKN